MFNHCDKVIMRLYYNLAYPVTSSEFVYIFSKFTLLSCVSYVCCPSQLYKISACRFSPTDDGSIIMYKCNYVIKYNFEMSNYDLLARHDSSLLVCIT